MNGIEKLKGRVCVLICVLNRIKLNNLSVTKNCCNMLNQQVWQVTIITGVNTNLGLNSCTSSAVAKPRRVMSVKVTLWGFED